MKRRLIEKWDTYQYVPLIPQLCKLLSDTTIIDQIDTFASHVHTTGLIEDFCDGSVFSNHPLFSQDSSTLQIVAYYDELEICNPLGSHTKQHKLGIVLYIRKYFSPVSITT